MEIYLPIQTAVFSKLFNLQRGTVVKGFRTSFNTSRHPVGIPAKPFFKAGVGTLDMLSYFTLKHGLWVVLHTFLFSFLIIFR